MHYLIITSEFPPGPGGIGKHAYCLAKALMHHGVEVTVVCNMDYASSEEVAQFKANQPEKLHIIHIKRKGVLTYAARVIRTFQLQRRFSFDKIIVSGQFSIWMGGLLKRLYKDNVYVGAFVHGSELLLGGNTKRKLTGAGLRHMNMIWPVSKYTASLLNRISVFNKVQVISNGLDISEWQESYPASILIGYPRLLTTGSLTGRKGQHNVINALPLLKQYYPEIHYHIVGLPIEISRIESLVKKLKVENHVTIHGKVSDGDLKRAYKSADIFCMLSEENGGDVEGFGIAVLEANINGVPAIGSRGTGIEDAIKDGINGKLVDAKDADEVLKAVQYILAKDKSILSADCINWALAHDWNEIVNQLL